MKFHPPPAGVDAISSIPLCLECGFNDTVLSQATGFIWQSNDQLWLITNWHVVSGRHFQTGDVLDKTTCGVPNEITIKFPREDRKVAAISVKIRLFDDAGNAKWLVHKQKRHNVDVVAVPVSVPKEGRFFTINAIKTAPIMQRVGMPLFVVGFPFGRIGHGFPIWKQGSFATEPFLSPQFDDYLLVDTASRPGMSGSIVLQRVHGMVTTELGVGQMMNGGDGAARFVGVYSGRLFTKNPTDVQLGIVWPLQWVQEITDFGVRDESVKAP